MAKKPRKRTIEKELSPRMRRFIDDLISEVEEAGIDSKHAADESEEPTSRATSSSSSSYGEASRPHRRESA